jgi:hypothetical protein
MIRRLYKKPDTGFEHLAEDYTWLECYDYNGPYCVVAIDIANNGIAALHAKMSRWNHHVLKSFLIDWEKIKRICKSKDCNLLVVTTRNTQDKKWQKFVSLFGFKKTDLLLVSQQEI